ncbi:MAG TPA: DUF3667 domain-containing protein [Pyrinomonadaceae bacterium]|nr:DUF3667 domain-containing protein [Pyrinomonadaceae bacterium]
MDISLETPPNSESLPTPIVCANCGAELTGAYCHRCGQKKVDRRDFSVKYFFRHLLHELTDLDGSKILKTLFALLFRPGLLTSEYLAGRKGSYLNPIRIYLTFSALYFLFAWGTLSDLRGGGAERTARSRGTIAMAKQRGIEPRALADQVYQKAEKYSAVLRFGSVLISGLFLSVFYIGAKRYYVEHLIFSLHYYSFDFFCKSVFALLFIISRTLGHQFPVIVLNLFYPVAFVYLLFALRRVYRQGWPITTIKSLVLFVCESLLFIGVNIAGFMIAFSRV